MSGSSIGKGSQLLYSTDGTNYLPIARVVNISGPTATVGTADSTHLGSTAAEFLPTIADWGEVTATIQYDATDTTHSYLTDLIATPAIKNWRIIFSGFSGKPYTFAGMLTGFNVSGVEFSTVVTAEITLKVSGAVTIT